MSGRVPHGDFTPVLVEDLHEPTDVGPLELVGKAYRHGNVGCGLLFLRKLVQDDNRIAEIADPNLIDRYPPTIKMTLNVDHLNPPSDI